MKKKIDVVNVKDVSEGEVDEYIGRSRDGDGDMSNTEIGKRGWLGNMYRLKGGYGRKESVYLFGIKFLERLREEEEFRKEVLKIEGTVGCWCKPRLCHGDVIKMIVEDCDRVEDVDRYIENSLEKLKERDEEWLVDILKRKGVIK